MPQQRLKISHAATKTQHSQINKYFKKERKKPYIGLIPKTIKVPQHQSLEYYPPQRVHQLMRNGQHHFKMSGEEKHNEHNPKE